MVWLGWKRSLSVDGFGKIFIFGVFLEGVGVLFYMLVFIAGSSCLERCVKKDVEFVSRVVIG